MKHRSPLITLAAVAVAFAIMFIFGFFMAGVNNWGHLGGFVGGYLVALAMGPLERAAERGLDRIAAFAAIAVTLIAFLMALWTGFRL